MNLQPYKTLVAIAEIGSFSRVAERLNMTLSAVSMQMKALERDLGVAMFDRAVRPPRLTPLGRDIAGKARHIVDARDALIALTQSAGTLRGEYRIGFIPSASVRLLPGFLARARASAPAARFTIETGLSRRLQTRITKGELDAAVVTRSDPDPVGLTHTVIRAEEVVYALPEGYLDESIETCLDALPFIQFMPDSGVGRLISNHLETQGYRPKNPMILDSIEAIMECVNTGIGFTALPRPDVERYAKAGVSTQPSAARPLMREMSLVTAKGSVADSQSATLRSLFTV